MSVPPEAYYVARTLQVLELVTFQPCSAPQVAAALGIHPRTARRTLLRLYEEEYLTRSADPHRLYSPSMRVVALAGQVVAHDPLVRWARPHVALLHQQTGVDAHLVIPSYQSVLCVIHADGSRHRNAHPRELVPAHATAGGKALLAWRQRWRDSVLSQKLEPHTQHTIVDPQLLAREADAIRARGFAIDDGEYEEGVRAVAAPVHVDGERAAAALCVSGPSIDIDAVAELVVARADELMASI